MTCEGAALDKSDDLFPLSWRSESECARRAVSMRVIEREKKALTHAWEVSARRKKGWVLDLFIRPSVSFSLSFLGSPSCAPLRLFRPSISSSLFLLERRRRLSDNKSRYFFFSSSSSALKITLKGNGCDCYRSSAVAI